MTCSVVHVSLRSQGVWDGGLHTTTPPMSNSIAVGGLDGPVIALELVKKYHDAVKVSWRIVASHGRCCRKVGGAWWTSAERAWSIDKPRLSATGFRSDLPTQPASTRCHHSRIEQLQVYGKYGKLFA
jgi:hypothetical protein